MRTGTRSRQEINKVKPCSLANSVISNIIVLDIWALLPEIPLNLQFHSSVWNLVNCKIMLMATSQFKQLITTVPKQVCNSSPVDSSRENCVHKRNSPIHAVFLAMCFVALPTQRNYLLSLRHPSLITFSSMEINTHQPREDAQPWLAVTDTTACCGLTDPV